MDKDNKYYEIIENLVKQHKKYQEYEAIIEDIIDDVYAHSEVIINSVTNEGVIEAYLKKVIATSMVTVPKKMGIRKYVKQVIVPPLKQTEPETFPVQEESEDKFVQEQPAEAVEDITKPQEDIKVNTEYVDKMINLAETPKEGVEIDNDSEILQIADAEDYEITDLSEEIPDYQGSETEDITETSVADSEEQEYSEDNDTETEETEIQPEELNNPEELSEADFITSQEEIETNTLEESELNSLEDDENSEDKDDLNILFEDSQEDNDIESAEGDFTSEETNMDLEIDENTVSDTVSLDFVPQEENGLEITDTGEDLTETTEIPNFETAEELVIEETIPDAEDNFTEDSNTDAVMETNTLIIEDSADGIEDFSSDFNNDTIMADEDNLIDSLSADSSSDLMEISESDISLTEVENTDFLEVNINDDIQMDDSSDFILEETKDVEIKKTSQEKTDFSMFAPAENIVVQQDDNKEYIQQDIIELNKKFPSLNIISVFNLRYKKNYTVEQIQQELQMDSAEIFTALSKISDVV